jgi:glycosyltransferase involved in cell wall biosynthesis
MQKSRMRISIVIPAYNEQDHLRACLEAIGRLSVKPFEVIVVNNNSTDKTVQLAEQFPFVSVINETRQGVVYARDCGCDAARGDIIGRIDADTILPADWTEKLALIFKDENVQAVSGSLHFYDIGWSRIVDGIETYWRGWMARRMEPNNRIFLLGANMAVRRSAWTKVSSKLCHKNGIHEDLDLALHMSDAKLRVAYDPSLIANLSARRIDDSLLEVYRYSMLSPSTYARHDAKESRYMYPIIGIVLVNYVVLRVLFKTFDDRNKRFKLKLLFSSGTSRVNPATYM